VDLDQDVHGNPFEASGRTLRGLPLPSGSSGSALVLAGSLSNGSRFPVTSSQLESGGQTALDRETTKPLVRLPALGPGVPWRSSEGCIPAGWNAFQNKHTEG